MCLHQDAQAVNHPYLVIYSPSASNAVEQAQAVLHAKAAAGLCAICHDPFEVCFFPTLTGRTAGIQAPYSVQITQSPPLKDTTCLGTHTQDSHTSKG